MPKSKRPVKAPAKVKRAKAPTKATKARKPTAPSGKSSESQKAEEPNPVEQDTSSRFEKDSDHEEWWEDWKNPRLDYVKFPHPRVLKKIKRDEWPTITFGRGAKTPRWTVIPYMPLPEEMVDDSKNMIWTHDNYCQIPGIRPGDKVLSYDSSVGLGGLEWRFEPGDESGWKGLNLAELTEYAWRSLGQMESDWWRNSQKKIVREVRQGPYQDHVRYAAHPMPKKLSRFQTWPKESPLGDSIGLERLGAAFVIPRDENGEVIDPFSTYKEKWRYPNFERPSLTFNISDLKKRPGHRDSIVRAMFEHQKGTSGTQGVSWSAYPTDPAASPKTSDKSSSPVSSHIPADHHGALRSGPESK